MFYSLILIQQSRRTHNLSPGRIAQCKKGKVCVSPFSVKVVHVFHHSNHSLNTIFLINVHRCLECVHPHRSVYISDCRRSSIFLMGAAQDQWYPIFIFWRSHDICHRPFESHAYELTRNHHAELCIYLAKAREVTPLNVLVAYVTGRSGTLFSMSDYLYTFHCQRSVLPGHASTAGFPYNHLFSGRNAVSPYKIDPTVIPTCPWVEMALVLLLLKKHQCFAFPPSISHWQDSVLKIISEVGYLFHITANDLGASMSSMSWHCLSDILLNQ